MVEPELSPNDELIYDNTRFGGICFDSVGFAKPTIRFGMDNEKQEQLFFDEAESVSKDYMKPLITQATAYTQACLSVGRIKVENALMSGFVVEGIKHKKLFISSTHAPAISTGIISFLSWWNGRTQISTLKANLVDRIVSLDLSVWSFEDESKVPNPLPIAVYAPQISDFLVSVGYCGSISVTRIEDLRKALPEDIRKKTAAFKDESEVEHYLHPHHKAASPGFVTQIAAAKDVIAVDASMYHGMSGGPAVLIHKNQPIFVGIVVGATEGTENLNCNTLRIFTDKEGTGTFLKKYVKLLAAP